MIQIKNLNYKFKTNNFSLSNINLEIKDNEFVCVIGKNGSGKSTLSKLISGLINFKDGEIFINGINLKDKKSFLDLRKQVSIVFQNPETQIIFDTVYDELKFSITNILKSQNLKKEEVDSIIKNVLSKVGMQDFINTPTSELSLGQKQKIAIATAISTNPKVLILDEPTTMLDPVSKHQIYSILKDLQANDMTIIFITNNIDEILYSDRILILENGNLKHDFLKKDLFNHKDDLKDFYVPSILSLLFELKENGIDIDLENFDIKNLSSYFKKKD